MISTADRKLCSLMMDEPAVKVTFFDTSTPTSHQEKGPSLDQRIVQCTDIMLQGLHDFVGDINSTLSRSSQIQYIDMGEAGHVCTRREVDRSVTKMTSR